MNLSKMYRLFFGGFWYIKLESIYIAKTNQNFNLVVNALSYFDAIISGTDLNFGFDGIDQRHFVVLRNLMNWQLNDSNTNNMNGCQQMISFDPYITSIFKSFIQSKKDVVIDYNMLDQHDDVNNNIVELIMHRFSKNNNYKLQRNEGEKINLFRPELVELFANIKSMTLITNRYYGDGHRSLSMSLLISMIKSVASLSKIVILSNGKARSWQSYLWKKSSTKLINQFEKSNYLIQLQHKIGPDEKYHGFVITRN